MKALPLATLLLSSLAVPAFASNVVVGAVSVESPTSGSKVVSPFTISASDATCSDKNVVSMGYSLDSKPNAAVVSGQSLSTKVTASLGSHVLHVKSWGRSGAACVTDVNITVVSDPVSNVPSVPAGALVFGNIEKETNWEAVHDDATGSGNTYGQMEMVGSPSLTGSAREFVTDYADAAGERYSDSFGSDTYTHNFLYDGWVYIAGPNNGLANLELDINQVIANGDTIILSFQCDGYTSTWDYGENAGSVDHTQAKWIHSTQKCNPRNWATNTWHHVQISDSRDDNGNVTYHAVWLDGVEQEINATVPGAFALGWGSVVQTNFQVDGLGSSGSTKLYLDKLTVYAW